MPLPLAAAYATFLETLFTGLAEPARSPAQPPVAFNELEWQSLWFAGEFGREFTTTCGQSVILRDFGIWNHAAGPDFIHCSMTCGDRQLRGDIELDPDVRDWERHGHAVNPAYNGVILHLFSHGPDARTFTRTAEHREVLQVHLNPALLHAASKPRHLPEAHLGRCAMPLAAMDSARVNHLLEAAAQYRLRHKARRLQTLIAIHGREQAIFQTFAAALGYRPNQLAFAILAQRLPLPVLLKLPAPERESLLFGVSGFLEAIRYEDTQPETRRYLRTLWSAWWKQRHAYVNWLAPDTLPPWTLSSTRPGNHPQRRLGALCAALQHWKPLVSLLTDANSWNARTFETFLLSLRHEYWSRHYTLTAASSPSPIALLGKTRCQEILANLVFPLLLPEAPALWNAYLRLPAVLDNQKVRRASLRLFGATPRAREFQKHLHQQQGLLQIYEDYCLEDDSACSECPFPERLKAWS